MRRMAGQAVLFIITILGLTCCSADDVVSIRMRLNPDLSGAIGVSAIDSAPEPDAGMRAAVSGVDWDDGVRLTGRVGSFDAIDQLDIHGITFRHGGTEPDVVSVRVEIPRGIDAAWPAAFSITPAENRRRITDAFSQVRPADLAANVGSDLTLELIAPGEIVSTGLSPSARGCRQASKQRVARLRVPIDQDSSEEVALVWIVTWRQSSDQ